MKKLILLLTILTGNYALGDSIAISQDKIKEIQKIKNEFQNQSIILRKKIDEKITKMDQLLVSDSDEKEIQQLFEQIKKIRIEHQNLRFESILKIRTLLPMEQRKYIKQLKGKVGSKGRYFKSGCDFNE